MNCIELKFARMRNRKTQENMAEVIGKSPSSYSMKELGKVAFSPDEIIAVSLNLGFTAEQINDIFFDGNLPFRKCNCAVITPST
ncbi:MAG: helix-turn-helix transcriptional regulator [Desulfosporosinus sp.]